MKKNKRLCKNIFFTLLLLISSVNMAWASYLKNNPVSTDKSENDDIYLTGTTFSIANEDSQTDKSYFKLSEVVFGRPIATIEMGNVFQEANGTWNNGGTTDAPRFTILSNPAELSSSYSEKTDKKNRLIFKTPNEDETILKIKVESFKPGSTFAFKVMVEELSGLSGATISMEVNGRTVQGNTLNVSSGRAAIWSPYNEDFQATDLSIEIKLDSGNGAVLAFSDMYIYGELENISISASTNVCNLGENVTLNAISGTGLNLGEVRWQKRTTSPDWFDLIDDAGVPKIGPSVVDTPQAGETCYRAVTLDNAGGSEVYSNEVCVTAEYKCAANSAHVLFTEDFGQLGGETERDNGGYGGEVEYINTQSYTYVENCKPLKENGTYAIMTNPKYGGYGELGKEADACSNIDMGNLWFRDLYDHTSDGLKDGEWGAMLMVNAAPLDGQAEQLVYSRTVDMDCPNTNMIFSAWFANAANPERVGDGIKVSMKFVVRDQNGDIIPSATLIVDEIVPSAGWVKGETSFNSGNNNQLTVEIYNCTEGGTGNDFMVDDISFSVCTPEVTMSVSSEDANVKINAEESLVEGRCGSKITLSLATGMADVIFDDPQYLWYVKGAGDSDFRLLIDYDNWTQIDTVITAWTEYYAVVTANANDKQAYIDGRLAKCVPVAVSNTYTVLCTPSMDAYLASQNCNKVLIGATVYDAAFDEIGAWWEKSTDGKNWQKIPRAVYHDTLRYEITEDTYFRLTNSKISSPATEKVLYRGISLTAEPSYGFYGTDVKLTAVTSNFGDMPNGPYYNWQRFEYFDGDWRQIDVDDHTIETINYTIEYPKDSIMVELYGCEATVLLKQVELLIDPMERECNTIKIQPIATIGGESTNYKWQSSSDGKNWVDVLEKNITKLEEPNCPECVEISFSEDCQFRIAAIDENGKETGFYSEAGPDEMLKVKKLELKAEPTLLKEGEKTLLTITKNYETQYIPEWYENDSPIRHTEYTYNPTINADTEYKVVLEGCVDSIDVRIIQPATVVAERNCNEITLTATVSDEYGDFWWEISKDEGSNWEKIEGKDNQKEIKVTITETSAYRVNNALEMPSNPNGPFDVWELTLDIAPKDAVTGKTEIDRGESVTLTANRDFSSRNPVQWYQDDEPIENENNPYSPTLDKSTSFYVTSEGCKSNTVNVTVIQPVEIVVKERECNNVTLEVKVEEGVVLPEYKWQISTFDSESSKWSEWSDYAGSVDKVVVSIDNDTKFQLVGDEISSEPTEAITYWSIELSIDKESIILGDDVTVTVESKYIDASETILWYKNDQSFDYDGDVYTEKPYGPASYQVTQGGCLSNVVNVKEVVWPTIFTPMAVDGFNDDFIIGMEPRVALQVFDRYGNLVVETTDGWDGKDKNGKYALPGVYYYIATLPNGEVVKGNVELLNEKK
ncbi:MAG: gliding motility-associated C-terminal domain-containing protein [Paludibacteraceae bacterium]|nr:gliding motility-associated C-terminal domain-containing protein [Paludibacteraceae bacterium]